MANEGQWCVKKTLTSPPSRMHYGTRGWLLRKWFEAKQDEGNGEQAGMCRLLCLNSWKPFLDLGHEDQEMLSQKLKSRERETSQFSLWQQRMWFRFSFRETQHSVSINWVCPIFRYCLFVRFSVRRGNTFFSFPPLTKNWLQTKIFALSPGEHVSTIASKTGTVKHAASKSRVVAEICDAQGTCCQTSSDGRGLDNSKVVRQAGQTDVYGNTTILGSCSQKVHSVYFDPWWRKVISLGCADLRLFWSIMFCAINHWPFLQMIND